MNIQEVKSTTKTHKISAHIHIKGLGLKKDGKAEEISCGKKKSNLNNNIQILHF